MSSIKEVKRKLFTMTSETVQKFFDALWVLKIFAVNYKLLKFIGALWRIHYSVV